MQWSDSTSHTVCVPPLLQASRFVAVHSPQAPLLVSNNTGAVHIAAAVGTPVVDLYALTNPQHTPWLVPHRVLSRDVPCRNCYKSVCPQGTNACLDIPVETVVAAACEVWNRVDRRYRRAA